MGVIIDKNYEPSPDYFGEFVVVIGFDEIVRCKTLAEAEARARLFAGIQMRDLENLLEDMQISVSVDVGEQLEVHPFVTIWQSVDFDDEDSDNGPLELVYWDTEKKEGVR